jgi:hypothetical protein
VVQRHPQRARSRAYQQHWSVVAHERDGGAAVLAGVERLVDERPGADAQDVKPRTFACHQVCFAYAFLTINDDANTNVSQARVRESRFSPKKSVHGTWGMLVRPVSLVYW